MYHSFLRLLVVVGLFVGSCSFTQAQVAIDMLSVFSTRYEVFESVYTSCGDYVILEAIKGVSHLQEDGQQVYTLEFDAIELYEFLVASKDGTTLLVGGSDGMYRSSDCGHSWVRSAIRGETDISVRDLYATPSGTFGCVAEVKGEQHVYHSQDGRTWKMIEHTPEISYSRLAINGAGITIAADYELEQIVTLNEHGDVLSSYAPSMGTGIKAYDMLFVSASVACVVTSGKILLYTSDAGATWQILPTSANIQKMYQVTPHTILALTYTNPFTGRAELLIFDSSLKQRQSYEVELNGEVVWSFTSVGEKLAVTTYNPQDMLATNLYWSADDVISAVNVSQETTEPKTSSFVIEGASTLHIPTNASRFELYLLNGQLASQGLIDEDIEEVCSQHLRGTYIVLYLDDQGNHIEQQLLYLSQ